MRFFKDGIEYSRSEMTAVLINHYGDTCYMCLEPLTNKTRTIDHFWPYSYLKKRGERIENINDFSNLRLACQEDNRLKSDLLPNEDGTINKMTKTLRPTKTVKSPVCETCLNGAYLEVNQQCPDCLLDNSKRRFPKVLQTTPRDCDHEIFHCFICVVHPELVTN